MTEISEQLAQNFTGKRLTDNLDIVVAFGIATSLALGLLFGFHPWGLPLVLATSLVQCASSVLARLKNERNGGYPLEG